MNYILFNQPGGFPLYTDTLDTMQRMYRPFLNALGSMAGNRAIICGCEEMGTKINAGSIQIDAEMYSFMGGIKQEYITIKEDKQEYEFENGQKKVTIVNRYAVFGSGVNSYKWADFKRVPALNTLQDQIHTKADNSRVDALEKRIKLLEQLNAPRSIGLGVELYTGLKKDIPAGYVIVAEYINKMLRASDVAGNEAGKDSHIITKNQVPAIVGTVDIIHPYQGENIGGGFKGGNNGFKKTTVNINNSGGGNPIPTIPYYRSIILIKWVGIGNGING